MSEEEIYVYLLEKQRDDYQSLLMKHGVDGYEELQEVKDYLRKVKKENYLVNRF